MGETLSPTNQFILSLGCIKAMGNPFINIPPTEPRAREGNGLLLHLTVAAATLLSIDLFSANRPKIW